MHSFCENAWTDRRKEGQTWFHRFSQKKKKMRKKLNNYLIKWNKVGPMATNFSKQRNVRLTDLKTICFFNLLTFFGGCYDRGDSSFIIK